MDVRVSKVFKCGIRLTDHSDSIRYQMLLVSSDGGREDKLIKSKRNHQELTHLPWRKPLAQCDGKSLIVLI